MLNRDHNAALEILSKGLEQRCFIFIKKRKMPLLDKTSKLFPGSMKPTSMGVVHMVGSRGMTGTLFGLIGTIPSALADQNPYYRRLIIAAALAVTRIMR